MSTWTSIGLVVAAVAGLASGIAAAGVFWLILTQPRTLVQVLAGLP
ncbi:MAG: hypothetical protein DIU54_006175 [Acidobacteriota bacterium]|jgi:hypothetical protein